MGLGIRDDDPVADPLKELAESQVFRTNAPIPLSKIFPYLLEIMTGVATSDNHYVKYEQDKSCLKTSRLELGNGLPLFTELPRACLLRTLISKVM